MSIFSGNWYDYPQYYDLARRMVTEFGMSLTLGPVRLAADPQAIYLGVQMGLDARVSPDTAAQVDAETRRIVEEALRRAWESLKTHRAALDRLAARLRERETVDGSEAAAILTQTVSGNGHQPGATIAELR